MWRVDFLNGLYVYLSDVVEVDDGCRSTGPFSSGPRYPAQVRAAVMTTSATSLGWEIMTTCEAPSISVTVAPIRS